MDNHEVPERTDGVTSNPSNREVPGEPPAPPTLKEWLRQNGPSLVLLVAGVFSLSLIANLSTVVLVALGLGLVIFVHELGHFLVAKWCDVHVETFSIGFGPPLPGCVFQRGETTYMLALFPLGGYVKMVGEGTESEEDEDDPRSFKNKSVSQRMAIISAGVIMNVLLAFLCFIVVYTHGRKQPSAAIGEVDTGGAAWQKGIPSGVQLTQIGRDRPNREVYFTDLKSEVLRSQDGQKVPLAYRDSDNIEHRVDIEPRTDRGDGVPMVGVAPGRSVRLAPAAIKKEYRSPVRRNSAAAAARAAFDFQPGDVIVGSTDPDNAAELKPLAPVVLGRDGNPAESVFELGQRWQRLADQPMVLQVRRKGARPQDPPSEIRSEPAEFEFDDVIIATTDPDHADRLLALPPDPRNPESGLGDYFEFRNRLQRLAGQFVTIQVRRDDGRGGYTEPKLMVPPAYHYTLGARMRVGKVYAVREGSPAEEAGVGRGDILKEVVLKDSSAEAHFILSQDRKANDPSKRLVAPVQLPYELHRWADARASVRVTFIVLRSNAEKILAPVTLPEVKWDGRDRWKFDHEVPLGKSSPVAIPGAGVAYQVETTVDDVTGPPAANEGGLRNKDEVKAVRFHYLEKSGKVEEGKWENLEPDQWAWAFEHFQHSWPELKRIGLRVDRDKKLEEIELTALPDPTWPSDDRGFMLWDDSRIQKADNFGHAVVLGLDDTFRQIRDVFEHIRGMATRRISYKNIGGPITIARVAYNVAGEGIWEFLFLIGMISINLAVINFLPIPVLDGGHMVFLVYEKLRGRPAPEQVRAVATYVGLALIICLMVFVLYLDMRRF